MTAARIVREALEGKREWREAVREEVSAALLSSPECRELALGLALGGEDFKAAEEALQEAVLLGVGDALSVLLSAGLGGVRECGEAMRRRSRRSVTLLTLFGTVAVERWHWTCAGCRARRRRCAGWRGCRCAKRVERRAKALGKELCA